jgi:hypothetical protein
MSLLSEARMSLDRRDARLTQHVVGRRSYSREVPSVGGDWASSWALTAR